MLTSINKRNPEYSAHEWMVAIGILVTQLLRKKHGESKTQRPLWKQFDDTHRWDSTAEEWVRNDDQ
jgi:hypothetical protein